MTKLRQRPLAIFLMGPTASGKTTLAMALCKKLPAEIISVDSALIYRGMDIGTAKPSAEELSQVPHRLINIINPTESYSVAAFYCDALKAMAQITAMGRIPLLVGGTMLYFKALLEGVSQLPPADQEIRARIEHEANTVGWDRLHQKLQRIDPIAAHRIHHHDKHRLSRALEVFFISGHPITELIKNNKCIINNNLTYTYHVYQFAIAPLNRAWLHQRIEQRFHRMLTAGFEQEVSTLFASGDLNSNMQAMRCVGYRQMWSYLAGETNYDNMVLQGISATRQLAKRQMTWLRSWRQINWLNSNEPIGAIDRILKVVSAVPINSSVPDQYRT